MGKEWCIDKNLTMTVEQTIAKEKHANEKVKKMLFIVINILLIFLIELRK